MTTVVSRNSIFGAQGSPLVLEYEPAGHCTQTVAEEPPAMNRQAVLASTGQKYSVWVVQCSSKLQGVNLHARSAAAQTDLSKADVPIEVE